MAQALFDASSWSFPPNDQSQIALATATLPAQPTSTDTSLPTHPPLQPQRSIYDDIDEEYDERESSPSQFVVSNVTDPANSSAPQTVSKPSIYDEIDEGYNDQDLDDSASNDNVNPFNDQPKWNFRRKPEERPMYFGHYLPDMDNSGTYNPLEEIRTVSSHRKRKRLPYEISPEEKDEDNSQEKVRKPMSLLAARQRGDMFLITLKLQSPAGKELLARQDDNWPEADVAFEENAFKNLSLDELDDVRNLRQRPSGDDKEATPDLTGHPEGRGCKPCWRLGQPCPLLEPDAVYPCYLCSEDDILCELLVPPKLKARCQQCKIRRWRCSYIRGGDHSLPCGECGKRNLKCVAGPAIDASRTRMMADGTAASAYSPQKNKKRAQACLYCRQENIECSLRYQTCGPCQTCVDWGISCASAPSRPRKAARTEDIPRIEPEPEPTTSATTSSSSTTTAPTFSSSAITAPSTVAAPTTAPAVIDLRASTPPTVTTTSAAPTATCKWCTAHPIDPSTPHRIDLAPTVIDLTRDDAPTRETIDLTTPTTTTTTSSSPCENCTAHFSTIRSCANHTLRPFPSPSDRRLCLRKLRAAAPGTAARTALGWFCGVCRALAARECAKGCGLRLCCACAGVLARKDGGGVGEAARKDGVGVGEVTRKDGVGVGEVVALVRRALSMRGSVEGAVVRRYWPFDLRGDVEFLVAL